MPREGMNKSEDSAPLDRLTGTLSPRFPAGYKFRLSNLLAPPRRRKVKAPAPVAAGTRASNSKVAEQLLQSIRGGGASQ